MGYTWKGGDGQIYDVESVSDRHLLFAHRRLRELIRDMDQRIVFLSLARSTDGVSYLTHKKAERTNGETSLLNEITSRGLTPLPIRTPEEIAEALDKQRYYEEWRRKSPQYTTSSMDHRIKPEVNSRILREEHTPSAPRITPEPRRIVRLPGVKKGGNSDP